jgi:lysyl-tRNA synthetase class 2
LGGDFLFLQSSPEFAMKRLLAAGAGSIFQITRAFRAGEAGDLHNPEVTMIEWYKVGAAYHELMSEVSDWLTHMLGAPAAQRATYHEVFLTYAKVCPDAPLGELLACAAQHGWSTSHADRDDLLNFLFGVVVQPRLGHGVPLLVHDFPASQAALAKIRPGDPPVAERFEMFLNGLELCNGYQELTDADELYARNHRQNEVRIANGKAPIPPNSRLLSAMKAGLPYCAGVAVGFDRIVMLAVGAQRLADVLAFPLPRC